MAVIALLHGRAAQSAISFGAITRQGYGGYPTTESANSSLTGTNAGDFKIDDLGHLVPASGGTINYGSAWTQTGGATSYTLTGGSGKIYNIAILANAAHIRERTVAGTHQDNANPSRPDLDAGFQLGNMLGIWAGNVWAPGGTTIWCRDGAFNPNGNLYTFTVYSTASYGGSGRITVRSETVDSSNDANGIAARQHGFKCGTLQLSGNGTNPTIPIDFRDIYFYSNATTQPNNGGSPANYYAMLGLASGHGFAGLGVYNCRFELGANVSQPYQTGACGPGNSATVNGCRFLNFGNMVVPGGAPTITSNYFDTWGDDCIHLGLNTFDVVITDNFATGGYTAPGNHVDFINHLGLSGSATGALGTISRNIDWSSDSQGIFYDNGDRTGKFTSATIENNIVNGNEANVLTIQYCDSPTIRWNTLLNIGSNGVWTLAGGTGGTITRNLCSSFLYTVVNTGPQTGYTLTPSPQTTLSTPYTTAFPSYASSPRLMTPAAVKAAFTPSSSWFNANNQAGALDSSGNWNAT